MHLLFVHQTFPAQFGHIASQLVHQMGWRCTFVSKRPAVQDDGIHHIRYWPVGGATPQSSYHTRLFEDAVAHAHGVYEAVKAQADLKPDLIVGHSGFGSTLFLRELFDAPIINFFEYFYRSRNSDLDFRPDIVPTEAKRLRSWARNAMILSDLDNCDVGYTPTAFQKNLFPNVYHAKLRQIFDGVDTRIFKPMADPPRTFGDRTISPDTRVVTYCARGFERKRGFDMFMQAARLIYQQLPNVVFLVVGEDRVCYGNEAEERGPFGSFRERVLAEGDYDLSKFIFLGRIAPSQLAQVLSLGDAHIYLTAPFVLSWSMMDAMACGALVIGSDTPPVREMIVDQETGLLADFFDPSQIADRTLEVLRDPDRFKPIKANAAQLIHDRYSLDVVLPQMIELYQSVL